jgi:hypothetical protein
MTVFHVYVLFLILSGIAVLRTAATPQSNARLTTTLIQSQPGCCASAGHAHGQFMTGTVRVTAGRPTASPDTAASCR